MTWPRSSIRPITSANNQPAISRASRCPEEEEVLQNLRPLLESFASSRSGERSDVLGLVVRQGMTLAAIGVVALDKMRFYTLEPVGFIRSTVMGRDVPRSSVATG
jgi:hypothetical protein